MTLGQKLQKLRKQSGLSQEALAEKVTVTRQTISKWELDQSTPDLRFIAQLSDIFEVSSDYLIREEMTEPDGPPFKKRTCRLTEKARRVLLTVLSAEALAAVCVCLICDYFTAGHLLWSWIAAASIAAAWLVILPCLAAKTNILLKTLSAASAVPFPFLGILALLLHKPVVFTLGACISLVSAAAVWSIYGIFRKCRKRLWRAFGFSLLVMIPVPIAILYLLARFLPETQFDFASDMFNSGITLILALACFGAEYLSSRRKEPSRK